MPQQEITPLVWARNRGRNAWDPPQNVGLEQSVESINVHLYEGGLGTRRGGASAIATTGVTGPINALIEYIPGQDVTASELFVIDSSATTKILRCAAGATFSNLTLVDNVASLPRTVNGVTLNGKLYLAYDSTVNRLHVFDPGLSTTKVRRAGMGTAAAPTVANTGGGAYPATLRFYRVAFTEQRGGVTVRRGLLGASVSFTPSGAGTAARVTKPASISEDETHWELYGSADGVTYYLLATTVVGTTTFDDSVLPSAYANNTAMPTEGMNTPFPSVKYLATDGVRLLGFGVWETTAGDSLAPKNGRVYFGPVLDSSLSPYAVNDDERINNTTTLTGTIDVARNAGAEDRGITPHPVNGIFYTFQSNGVYAIIPTESPIQPYRRELVDADIGLANHEAIVIGTNGKGQPTIYFWDPVKGPMTVGGPFGLRWCGKDIVDWSAGSTGFAGTDNNVWGLWYPDKQQVWFGSETAQRIVVLDVTELYEDEDGDLRGGWTVYDDKLGNSRCGVLYASALTATRPLTKVPYVANGALNNLGLGRYDETISADYAQTAFNTTIRSGILLYGLDNLEIIRSYVFGFPNALASDVTITQSLIPDTVDPTTSLVRTSTVVFNSTGTDSATSVRKKFEDAVLQNAWGFQVQLRDNTSANFTSYTLREWRADAKRGSRT